MTIKQQGGIFGRNPTFNDVEADGTLTVTGQSTFNSNITVQNDENPKISILDSNGGFNAASFLVENGGRDLAIFAQQDIIIDSNSGELARFLKDGGLTFNGDTANSNALDDYEEGTWTPTFSDSTSGGTTTGSGVYTKVGNKVTVHGSIDNIDTTGLTGSNKAYILGLPFTSTSSQKVIGNVWFNGGVTTSGACSFYIQDSGTYARFFESPYVSTASILSVSDFTDDAADININATYIVS